MISTLRKGAVSNERCIFSLLSPCRFSSPRSTWSSSIKYFATALGRKPNNAASVKIRGKDREARETRQSQQNKTAGKGRKVVKSIPRLTESNRSILTNFTLKKRRLLKYPLFRFKLQEKEEGYKTFGSYNAMQLNHREKLDMVKRFYYKLWLRKFFRFYLKERKLTKIRRRVGALLDKNKKRGGYPLQLEFLEEYESQLFMVLFRAGFVMSRGVGEQMVKDGLVLVNNKPVLDPLYRIKEGEIVHVKKTFLSYDNVMAKGGVPYLLSRLVNKYYVPSYLEVCYETMSVAKVAHIDADLDLPYLYKKHLPFEWFIRDFQQS